MFDEHDVRNGKCIGSFGLGTGFYAEESHRGIFGFFGRSFCMVCPLERRCRMASVDEVQREHEQEWNAFFAARALASQIGISTDEVEMGMMRVGNFNPILSSYIENIQLGIEAREEVG